MVLTRSQRTVHASNTVSSVAQVAAQTRQVASTTKIEWSVDFNGKTLVFKRTAEPPFRGLLCNYAAIRTLVQSLEPARFLNHSGTLGDATRS